MWSHRRWAGDRKKQWSRVVLRKESAKQKSMIGRVHRSLPPLRARLCAHQMQDAIPVIVLREIQFAKPHREDRAYQTKQWSGVVSGRHRISSTVFFFFTAIVFLQWCKSLISSGLNVAEAAEDIAKIFYFCLFVPSCSCHLVAFIQAS